MIGVSEMKRTGDDVHTSSPSKRHVLELKTDDVSAYIAKIQQIFKHQQEIFHMFLDALDDYDDHRLDIPGLIARIKEIFKGRNDLIRGFSIFLPEEHTMDLDEEAAPENMETEHVTMRIGDGLATRSQSKEPSSTGSRKSTSEDTLMPKEDEINLDGHELPPSVMSEGFQFCEKVEERLGIVDEYWKFLKWIQVYLLDLITERDLQLMVNLILGEHHDLLNVFNWYIENVNIDEFLFGVMSMEIKRTGQDLPLCWHYDEPSWLKAHNPFISEIKATFEDETEKYLMLDEYMKDWRAKRSGLSDLTVRVKELFKGHNNLIRSFNKFMPKGYEIDLDEDGARTRNIDCDFYPFNEGYIFCEKVKERLGSVQEYRKFLTCVRQFNEKNITKQVFQNAVNRVLGEHGDLVDEINQCLNKEYTNELSDDEINQSLKKEYTGNEFFDDEMNQFFKKTYMKEFLAGVMSKAPITPATTSSSDDTT